MSIASYIKVIGRGRDGARSLDRAQAHDLMSQVLDGRVTDLEIGAFALAMRIKGETVAELAGFLDAVHERCIAMRIDRPTVVLPSYNGSRKAAQPDRPAGDAAGAARRAGPGARPGARPDAGHDR